MTFTQEGHIVLARGHLRKLCSRLIFPNYKLISTPDLGGVAMHLKVNRKTGGTYTCSSHAIYGGKLAGGGGHSHGGEGAETITDMENCNPHPIKVSAGDTMVMTSEYNLKDHPL
jgi:hypothetical protein